MMEFSSDPYEQKLFNMFQSHDPNENGLDETALIKLCISLELNDQGNYLIKSLIKNSDSRVTFKAFKEALLNFLGEINSVGGGGADNMEGNDITKTLVISGENNDEKYLNDGPISPGREISPKLIMGTKKYGRRSRPQSLVTDSSHTESEDDDHNNRSDEIGVVPNINNKLQKVQRSSSQSEIHANRRRRPTSGGTKLKRCASLPAQKKQQQINQQNPKEKLLTKNKSTNLQKENDQKQITSSVESLGNIDFENLTHTINDIWKNYTNELGTQNLTRKQLVLLCQRIGLFCNVADKVAEEIFEKLNLNPNTDCITFKEFIELINCDTTTPTIGQTNGSGGDGGGVGSDEIEKFGKQLKEIIVFGGDGDRLLLINNNNNNKMNNNFINFNNINNIIIDAKNCHKDSLCTLVDTTTKSTILSSSSINRDLHVQDIPQQLETVPANSIIEMWETSNINDAKGLLTNLGFDDDEIHVGQLTKVLEEELRGSSGETQMILLKASLAIQKAEVTALQLSFRQLYDENKKLHSDNKDANKRAALLAQEIDERHANLEDSTKTEIRLLEQRHTEVIRDLTAQLANDRENWSNLNVRLEKRIKILEQDETRLKNDLQSLKDENNTMENEQLSIQKQITNLLETNIKLNNEIVELEEKQRNDDNVKENEEVLELIDKIRYLQIENTNLRDKNDELTSELEGLNIELTRIRNKKSSTPPITTISSNGQPVVRTNINNIDTSIEILSDDPEHSSLGIKRRGDSPSKAKLTEESPRTGKLRKCNNDNNCNSNSESETSGDWVALNSELNNIITTNATNNSGTITSSGFSQDYSSISDSKDDEIKILKEKINKLENQLKELQETEKQTTTTKCNNNGNDVDDKNKIKTDYETIETRCKDLEASLDQMRKAYEDCEDYWQTKLNEERQMFDKERQIYEDEQIESDKKFTELMEKVREYEEQYSKDDRLSTIDEKDVLEQQFADMEAEVEETRENARKIFEEKTKEIDLLREKIQELNMRLISNGGTNTNDNNCNVVNSCSNNNDDDGLAKSNSLLNDPQQQKTQQLTSELESPASSPISYLWNQSTIQAPARDYQNPNWSNNKIPLETSRIDNLTTSDTSIFSTNNDINNDTNSKNNNINNSNENDVKLSPLNPIQKPISSSLNISGGNNGSIKSTNNCNNDDNSSTTSVKSFESNSVASTHSVQKSSIDELSTCSSPNGMKEELQRLKYFEVQLREQIKDLAIKRDSLVMELQQLQEAKPVLEKAYARAAHPTLIQRVNMLEQKNRHLQTVLRQQQQYTESIMHQTWQQQRTELTELRNRLETQGIIMTEQAQRLAQADVLVKDLYVENSHLSATIQRLEQQRSRANLLQQHHHHQQQQQQSSLNGVPGMP